MIFELGQVLGLLAFVALCLYFLSSIRIRELALDAVVKASTAGDFQLLDQSVHLRKISVSRDTLGRWHLWRQYRFDYTLDGVNRRQGHVIMLARQLQALVFR